MLKKLSLIIIALICCNILSSASDVTLDLTDGDIVITDTGYSQGSQSESGSFSYLITTSAATPNSLIIENGGGADSPIEITLENLTIEKDLLTGDHETAGAPISINRGYVTFTLVGSSVVKSIAAFPGLALEGDAYLTVKGDGTLKAYGSEMIYGDQYSYRCGAGIGPNEKQSLEKPTGHLTIESGNVYGYSMGGGYGFGTGAANVYNGSISSGSLTINGGSAHFFGGYHPYDKRTTEGIGSRHTGVKLYLNGGELEAYIDRETQPYVNGEAATLHSFENLSPYYTAKLPGMLNQAECGAIAVWNGSLPYWTLGEQTFNDFIDGRILLMGKGDPAQNSTIRISGLGLFNPGDETELTAQSNTEELIFDHWSFGSTENPVKYTVSDSETVTAVFRSDPQKLWRMEPIEGHDDECFVSSFYSGMYFTSDILELPSTFEIDGNTYKVTEIGSESNHCSFRFQNKPISTFILPSTLSVVPSDLFSRLSEDMMFMYPLGEASLKSLICYATVPPSLRDGEEFENLPADCELTIPVESLEAYRNDPAWGKFAKITPRFGENDVVIDLSEGNVTITDEGYSINDSFNEYDGGYVFMTSSTSDNEIIIEGGSSDRPLKIILDNIDVNRWNTRGNGISIRSGYVEMWIVGENNITGGHDGAGIWLPAESTLTINGDGKLTAKAGSTVNGAWLAGAGIGGAVAMTSVGKLIINSGSVYGYGILGSTGFGSGSVWNYSDKSASGYGELVLNGGDAHFFGSSDHQYNTVAIPEGVGTPANVPVVVFNNGGELEATLSEGTPIVTDGKNYERHSQPGMAPGMKFTLINHLGMDKYETTTDAHGNLVYWLAEGQTRKDVTGYDFAVEVYADKEGYGSLTGGGMYNYGDEAEIAFAWQQGNHDFICWSDGTVDNPYRFTVEKDEKFTAKIVPSEQRSWRVDIARNSETGELSETDCYVSYFDGGDLEIDVLEVPGTFEIDGIEYITVSLGDNMEGMFNVNVGKQLENFIIPTSVKNVSSELGFVNSKIFTCLASTPPAIITRWLPEENETGFYDISEDAILRVPFGTSSLYRAAKGWQQFNTIEELRPEEETWLAASHTDEECHIYAYAHPETFVADRLDVPEIVEIEGKIYTVTTLGHPITGEIDLNVEYELQHFSLPSTITTVSPFLFGNDEVSAASMDKIRLAKNSFENLKYVICDATVPPALTSVDGYDSFARIPSSATLVVPEGSVESYAAAPGWKDFQSIDTDRVTSIDEISDNRNEFDGNNVEIFTLQGLKVNGRTDTLNSGLYIIRKGDKILKVLK